LIKLPSQTLKINKDILLELESNESVRAQVEGEIFDKINIGVSYSKYKIKLNAWTSLFN
jgi:hypothetical protein